MNFKKTLSLVLAVLMVITVIPFSGIAADSETCEHGYYYEYYKNNKHIRECPKCNSMDFEDCSGGEATCGQQAVCDYCKKPYGETPAHDFTNELKEDKYIADEGDCRTEKTYYTSCKVCGASSKDDEAEATFKGAAKGDHKWDDGVSNNDATCTEDGTKKLTCTVDGCGATDKVTDEGSAKGHTYTQDIKDEAHLAKEGTCKEKTRYYYDCAYCDANAKDAEDASEYVYEGETLPHLFVVPAVPTMENLKTERTCTTLTVFYKVCYDCGISAKGIDENETYEYGELAEHKYIDNIDLSDTSKNLIAEATCTAKAIYEKSCSVCGISALDGKDVTDPATEIYIEGEDIPAGKTANAFRYGEALKHGKTYVSTEAKEATCTEDGCTEGVTCEYCGVVLTESQKIEKLGHSYDLNNPIEAYKAPTCKQDGTIGKVECTRCKSTFAVNEKNEVMSIDNLNTFIFALEPLGHVDSDGDMVCDRDSCGALLEPEDVCSCICHGTGIMYFVGLILKWFWKLTQTRPYCDCGNAHYEVD